MHATIKGNQQSLDVTCAERLKRKFMKMTGFNFLQAVGHPLVPPGLGAGKVQLRGNCTAENSCHHHKRGVAMAISQKWSNLSIQGWHSQSWPFWPLF